MTTMNESPEERAKRIGVPCIPKLPPMKRYESNPVVAVCGECGRDVHMYEGYCCGRGNCPMQSQVIA